MSPALYYPLLHLFTPFFLHHPTIFMRLPPLFLFSYNLSFSPDTTSLLLLPLYLFPSPHTSSLSTISPLSSPHTSFLIIPSHLFSLAFFLPPSIPYFHHLYRHPVISSYNPYFLPPHCPLCYFPPRHSAPCYYLLPLSTILHPLSLPTLSSPTPLTYFPNLSYPSSPSTFLYYPFLPSCTSSSLLSLAFPTFPFPFLPPPVTLLHFLPYSTISYLPLLPAPPYTSHAFHLPLPSPIPLPTSY